MPSGLVLLSHQGLSEQGVGSVVGWDLNCPPPDTVLPPTLDVYSYDEDDMVLDPNLAEHLSHFGIDMLKMQKVRLLSAQILSSLPVRPSLFARG